MPNNKIDTNQENMPEHQDKPNTFSEEEKVRDKDAKEVIAEVAEKEKRPEEKIVPTEQLVTFELDKEEYASVITDLREIIKIPEIVPIPGAPDFIRGILNLRGQIVVIIDLEKRFHLKREHPMEPLHIIIAEVEDSVFGVVVDEVTGVLRVPVVNIKPTPALITSKIHADYLKGVVILGEAEEREKDASLAESRRAKVNAKKTRNNKDKKRAAEKLEEEAGPEKETAEESRLILLLDIPKMLAEKELLEFGSAVQKTAVAAKVE